MKFKRADIAASISERFFSLHLNRTVREEALGSRLLMLRIVVVKISLNIVCVRLNYEGSNYEWTDHDFFKVKQSKLPSGHQKVIFLTLKEVVLAALKVIRSTPPHSSQWGFTVKFGANRGFDNGYFVYFKVKKCV